MPRNPETISFWCGRLPHWEVEDGRYFVTLHLAGAIPAQGWDRIREIRRMLEVGPVGPASRAGPEAADRNESRSDCERRAARMRAAGKASPAPLAGPAARLRVQRMIFREMERWLDRAPQVKHLSNPDVAKIVIDAIEFRRQSAVWNMFAYVVMPNHIHLFFEILTGGLKPVLESFKRWTGHEAGKIVDLDASGFWQDEWFDHWSRSDAEDQRIAEYIRRNPEKAGLVTDYRQWPYGSSKQSNAE